MRGIGPSRLGVFGPGHLGELTGWVPGALVDEVLAATGRVEKRVRLLPARVVVYFVLAMVLFMDCGYGGVWASLVAGLPRSGLSDPSSAALRHARRRLGAAPLAMLFDRLRGPVASAGTVGAFWRGLRVVAWDGTSLEVAGSAANVARFGLHGSGCSRPASYPQVRLTALVECGTRALIAVVFGPRDQQERVQAHALLSALERGMLLLADRGYDGFELIRDAAATGADLLWRMHTRRNLPVLHALADGSHLSVITDTRSMARLTAWLNRASRTVPPQVTGVAVRVISFSVTVTTASGERSTTDVRLITTLLDPDRYPATELAALYHERWEAETAYFGLKVTLRGADRVLRSHWDDGVDQEIYALLIVFQITRMAMTQAATAAGIDPDRLSFTIALRTARLRVITAAGALGAPVPQVPFADVLVLARNLGPRRRRSRISPRCVKRTLSPYAYNKVAGSVGGKKPVEITIAIAPS
ncbi:IS4 family transposase [Kitasatospora purpeofusca]|uniref:IS4 family transposase n=1 Tax=Kitasatospora purpeofusca TaxID=67352 RepID=UPI00225854BB|nr:IS4 family transposase [Kitasatospora purpeofusca]MCX4757204.1 IS4 family transposase [Kitasatospora purpeofusca]WSR37457.1 IS4 family transposase [Kitasatospora purpeofusca]WSR45514.1 IS4 family transposase [Kitasatospora purpeofusca]WSR45703.1 IS4 family transposase [Kitasatospora purpeofusca]